MTKEQENAIKTLENFIDHFQTLIKQADKANDEAFDREQAEQDIKDFKTAIQAIKDLDTYREPYNKGYEDGVKATQVSASLTFEDILDEIKAEIQSNMETITGKYDSSVDLTDMPSYKIERNTARGECLQIIDKYEKVVSE